MTEVTIQSRGCRECAICVEVCPTRVFEREAGKVTAPRPQDCVQCLSCVAECPSRCLSVKGSKPAQPPFHRIEENTRIVERMLRTKPTADAIDDAAMERALRDVRVRLLALGESVTETMGRGVKAVGRKAGALSAEHLPDLYEGRDVRDVLTKMSERFGPAFSFESTMGPDGKEITLNFPACAMARVVREGGQAVGTAVLCTLFHEFWAGLVGSFTGKNYVVELGSAGEHCCLKLVARS